jgi:hypothetical protein
MVALLPSTLEAATPVQVEPSHSMVALRALQVQLAAQFPSRQALAQLVDQVPSVAAPAQPRREALSLFKVALVRHRRAAQSQSVAPTAEQAVWVELSRLAAALQLQVRLVLFRWAAVLLLEATEVRLRLQLALEIAVLVARWRWQQARAALQLAVLYQLPLASDLVHQAVRWQSSPQLQAVLVALSISKAGRLPQAHRVPLLSQQEQRSAVLVVRLQSLLVLAILQTVEQWQWRQENHLLTAHGVVTWRSLLARAAAQLQATAVLPLLVAELVAVRLVALYLSSLVRVVPRAVVRSRSEARVLVRLAWAVR